MAKPEFTNQLLKEAIADAEAVRQTAIENAKLSLEETFTPQIKSMLERKLRAEAEGMGEAEMEEATELPHEDAEAEGSTEMPADSSEIGGAENKEPSPEAEETSDIGTGPEAETDASTDWYDDWSEKDFDLDEVIKELEEDVKLMEAEEGEEEEGDEDAEEEEGEKEGEEDEAGEKEDEDKGEYPESEPAGDEEAKEEIPHKSSEIGEKDAAKFTLDEFISMMKEAGYNLEVHPAAEYVDTPSEPPMEEEYEVGDVTKKVQGAQASARAAKGEYELGDVSRRVAAAKVHAKEKAAAEKPAMEETDLNLEEILAMLEAEDASIQEEQAPEQMASEVTKLQEEIAEYRTAVEFLRGKLNEVNLLNAKLLYTNKIFRKEGLTNEQKVTIVENFDRATTVREVKMVYAVLAETLKGDSKSKTTKLPRKVVSEGLASKATPSTAPKTETPEIIAENSVTKRLQQLAGIIS